MSTDKPPLAGCRVLVTRPEPQAAGLIELVHRSGGEAIVFPTIEIVPLEPSADQIEHLFRAEMVIFISANAVAHGFPFLRNTVASDRKIVAIGPSTKKALEALGNAEVLGPDDESSSEELLKQPVMQDVDGLKICIVRGRGGRETLQQTLTARGARVSYLECYRRQLPRHWDVKILAEILVDTAHTLIVSATSVVGLSNLINMLPAEHKPRLLSRALVVIGERQRKEALQLGWRGPVLESGVGDDQIVETIARWRHQHQ